jgi:hypothetical protein
MQRILFSCGAWLAILVVRLPMLSGGEGAQDLSLAGALGNLSLGSAYSSDGAYSDEGPRISAPPVSLRSDVLALAAADGAPAGGGGGALVGHGDSRVGRAMLKGAIGFTLSPSDFLLALEADYFVTNGFAVGPLFQFGLWDDPFILAPSLNFKGVFDLPEVEGLKPIVEGGLGLVYMDEHHRHWDADETGFLLNFGGGLQYFIDDPIAIGSEILFNFIPDEVLGDHFFFSWQLVTVSFLF